MRRRHGYFHRHRNRRHSTISSPGGYAIQGEDAAFKQTDTTVQEDAVSYIIGDECTGCGKCLKRCPEGAISGEKGEIHIIDQSICTKCGICYDTCRAGAVIKV